MYNDYDNNNDTTYAPTYTKVIGSASFAKKFNAKTNQWLRLMVFTYVVVCAYVFKYAVVS